LIISLAIKLPQQYQHLVILPLNPGESGIFDAVWSKHVNLRTRIKRLVRRTICFSKTERMHELVIGLFVNRYEFGRVI
jgi:IS1 transposase